MHIIDHEVSFKLLSMQLHTYTQAIKVAAALQGSDSDSDSDNSTVDEVTVAVHNDDGTRSSAAQHELQIAAELAAQPAWFGGGRFGGRAGKLARIRQQEALAAAKLGLAPAKAELAPAVTSVKVSKKRKTPSSSPINSQTAADSATITVTTTKVKASKKCKQKQEPAENQAASASEAAAAAEDTPVVIKKRIVVEPAFTATAPAVPFIQTPSSGWWGAKKFTSAGCLEGIDKQQNKAQSERQQFDEDDQANLYMAAQNLKTSGKKGLGTKAALGQQPLVLLSYFQLLMVLMYHGLHGCNLDCFHCCLARTSMPATDSCDQSSSGICYGTAMPPKPAAKVLKWDEAPMTLHSSSLSGNRGLTKSPLALHFDFDCREYSQQLLNSLRLVRMTALSKKPFVLLHRQGCWC